MTESKQKSSFVPTFFAYVAITMGMLAFVQAAMKGHSAGWEEMMLYTGPAVICALLAIAMRRDKNTYTALLFAGLAIVGLVLGA